MATLRFRPLAFAAGTTLIAVAAFTSPAFAAPASQPPRPNVIIVMPDDVSHADFTLYDSNAPRTPNIDRLGRESVRLTDFHVSPTCSPTRAALLTGRYTNATGAWHTIMGRSILLHDEVTMAEVFRANGYRTAISGKWHLGDNFPYRPQDRGFDHVIMHGGGGVGQQHDVWGNTNLVPSTYLIAGRPVPLTDEDDGIPGAFSTNFFTSRAIEWCQTQIASATPFFLYLAYPAAHAPFQSPPDARPGLKPREAAIENIDKNIGRLLAWLDRAGIADDTLLLFLTDNGSSGHYRAGKGSEFEGGHRVPCFLRWKAGGYGGRASTGREVDTLAAHIDVLPTLMDLLGLKDVSRRPASVPLQGQSLRSVLDSDPDNDAPALRVRTLCVDNQREQHLVKYKQFSVMRDERNAAGSIVHKWRLVRPSAAKQPLLFDVLADPKQTTDLSGDPAHAPLIASLATAYEAWWRQVSARAAAYARIDLGADAQPDACLYSHDWHTEGGVPWNHDLIAGGPNQNGFHAVQFQRAGSYRFELRRWPREIAAQTTLSSALETPTPFSGNRGVTLPIRSARIRIWNDTQTYADRRFTLDPAADAASITIDSMPAGPAFIQTWFYDAAEKELCGAYYVYVEAMR